MSQQSITDKAQIIRTETQKYGNTRERVADVLDDINETKANNVDLSSLASSMQAADSALSQDIQNEAAARANADSALSQDIQDNTDSIDSIQQELSDINAEQVQQNDAIATKLDKPNSDGSYYITKITVAGTSYYQYRVINLSSGQIPVSMGTYIGASLLYESVSGRIGLDTPNPSEKFEVYNGRVKSDGFILTSSTVSPLPKEIKFKDGNFVGAKDDGIERKFIMDNDLFTKLDKPLSPNNISTRVINADNSTSDKGEFQQSEQIEINTSQTAQASWRGKEVWVTASCTLTIPDPATLPPFWSIDIFVLNGTLTHAITSPATWIGTAPANATTGSYYRIVRRGNTNTFKVLGL